MEQRENPVNTRDQLEAVSDGVQRTYPQRMWERALNEWPTHQPALEQRMADLQSDLDALPGGPPKDIDRLVRLYQRAMDTLSTGTPEDVSHGTIFLAWRETHLYLREMHMKQVTIREPMTGILGKLRAFHEQFATTAGAPTMQAMQPSIEHMKLKVPADRHVRGELSRSLRFIGLGFFGLVTTVSALGFFFSKNGKMQALLGAAIGVGGAYATMKLHDGNGGWLGRTGSTEALFHKTAPYHEAAMQNALRSCDLSQPANRDATLALAERVWSEDDRKQLNRDLTASSKDPAQMASILGLDYATLTPNMQRLFQQPDTLTVLLTGFRRIDDPDARDWVRDAIAQQVVVPQEPLTREQVTELRNALAQANATPPAA